MWIIIIRILFLFILSTVVASHTLTFQNLFPTPRLLLFTPSTNSPSIPAQLITASQILSLNTTNWNGSFKALPATTDPHNPGPETHILGEVCFGCYEENTFFDVSAIWNCCDNEGVHWMWGYEYDEEKGEEGNIGVVSSKEGLGEADVSGCETFPCEEVYNEGGDVETKSSTMNAIWVVLGP